MARILIVDDEKSIRRTLGEFLRAEGYEVFEAEDADAAQQRLREAEFDVVVSDIILPRVTGVELLRRIHASSPHVQVVMMTGEPTVETATEALRAGAADYLFKPITKAAILRAVANAVRIKSLEDTRRRLEVENQAHRENLERLVTERTAQLQESERRFRSLYENALMGLYRTTPDGRILLANPALVSMLGYESFDALARQNLETRGFHPDYPRQQFKERLEGEGSVQGLESAWTRADGSTVFVRESACTVRDDAGGVLYYDGVVEDITERKRAEDQLRKLARAVEQSPASIVITDRAGNIEFVNPKFSQVTGYTAEEVVGRNPRILKSGETTAEEYRQLWETITAGREWHGEFHNKRKDGTLFWETASISPIRDAAGEIKHFIAVKEDVTEQKLTQAKLLRAQRVESIGSLASGIAHDLNNILTPILMCAPMLQLDDSPETRRELAQTIETSAQRAVGIVKQLLSFARGKEGQKQPLQMRHLVRDMAKIIRETFPRSIQVEEDCDPNLWPVLADATQLHQVLLNLCVNARDAMPGGGKLTLEAANVTLDEHFVAMHKEAEAGPFVRLRVTDTGTGIPETVQAHIFESFFTTKGEGAGTGLGLSTVKGIVKNHKGFITFTTAPGRGTTFEVHLPAATEARSTAEQTVQTRAMPRGEGELILVVDDEPAICDTTRRTLERQGYRVLQAHNGIEALAQYSAHQQEVRAVVTDFMMPLMDGVTLCRALRALSPQTPLVVSSGGLFGKVGAEASRALEELGVRHVLQKPHNADLLLQTLCEVLGRPVSTPRIQP
ncbi:MAG TPA: response regulator [Verrucomicrobiae bacterium]